MKPQLAYSQRMRGLFSDGSFAILRISLTRMYMGHTISVDDVLPLKPWPPWMLGVMAVSNSIDVVLSHQNQILSQIDSKDLKLHTEETKLKRWHNKNAFRYG